MNNKELLLKMISDNETREDILSFVRGNLTGESLGPVILGKIFEVYAGIDTSHNDDSSYFSRVITFDELSWIHPNFKPTNGCQWARNNSYLYKIYKIRIDKRKGSCYSIKLDGKNDTFSFNRTVSSDIKKTITQNVCPVTGSHSNIEVDHKDGRYTSVNVSNNETQTVNDFQPLTKSVNDIKRQHCAKCIESRKRFDARILGFKEGWILGDEDTSVCAGCYWYDVKRFHELISADYVKE